MINHDGPSPEKSFAAAQELAVTGRFTDAIRLYSLTLNNAPDHVKARAGRGLAYQRTGDHPRAIADFDELLSAHPNWAGAFVAYYGRAVSKEAIGENLDALADCDEAIRRSPQLIDAVYLRGGVRKNLGLIEEAIGDMDAVLAVDPSYHAVYEVRGRLYYLQGSWRQAVDDFTAAIEHRADNSEELRQCLYLRGMAFQGLRDHSSAIADFNRAIEMSPNDAGAYLRRSRSYRELGEVALADADFQTGKHLVHVQ